MCGIVNIMGILSFLFSDKTPEQKAEEVAANATEAAVSAGDGFLGFLGNLFKPLLLIGGLVLGFLALTNEKFREGIGNLFGGIGEKLGFTEQKVGDEQTDQPETQNQPRTAPIVEGELYKGKKEVTLQKYDASDTTKFSNDTAQGAWVTVDAEGNPIAGNSIDRKGDIMSTGKLISAGVIKELIESKELSPDFLEKLDKSQQVRTKDGMRPVVQAWLQNSSNEAADLILKAAADEMGVGQNQEQKQDYVIDRANQIIKEKWGMKHTSIANFSGLTTSWDGTQHRYVREGADSASTPYELAMTTMTIGRKFPELSVYADAGKSQTGLAEHQEYELAKSGTGNGDEGRTSGMTKSMAGYDMHSGGAIAVLEQGVSNNDTAPEWHAAINSASKGLQDIVIANKENTTVAANNASAEVNEVSAPAATPATAQASQQAALAST
jgi:hypothetical protein